MKFNDTEEIVNSPYLNWDFFRNSAIMVTGATGLIGSQIVKALLYANETLNTNIKIIPCVRNREKAEKMFNKRLDFVVQDIIDPITADVKSDFIIHTANGTSSKGFVENPVETIDAIILGTKNILEYAKRVNVKSVVYLSSMEVYGNIPLDRQEPLKEDDYGYMDLAKVRNSYPQGKRLAENMCVCYTSEYNLPVKVARLSQVIGADVDYNDKRVFAEFARNIVEKKDIILKTLGATTRSYCYITDAVAAILLLLEKGNSGESYNVANPETTCSIKEMAEMLCANYPESKLRIEADLHDTKQYLGTLKYYLSTEHIFKETGWKAKVNLETMFARLIETFKSSQP